MGPLLKRSWLTNAFVSLCLFQYVCYWPCRAMRDASDQRLATRAKASQMGRMLGGCLESDQGACSSQPAHELASIRLRQVFDFNDDSWASFCARQSFTTVSPALGRQLFLQVRRLAGIYWYWSVFEACSAESARQLGVFIEKQRAPQATPELIEERARVWRLYRGGLRVPSAGTLLAADLVAPGSARVFTHPLWGLLFSVLNQASSPSSRSAKQSLKFAQAIRPEFLRGMHNHALQTKRFWSSVVKSATFLDKLFVALMLAQHAATESDPDAQHKWQHRVYSVTLLHGWTLSRYRIHGPFLDLLDQVFCALSQNLEARVGLSRNAHLPRMRMLASEFYADPKRLGKSQAHFGAWASKHIWGKQVYHLGTSAAISPDLVPVDPSNVDHRIAAAHINCERAEFYRRYIATLEAVMLEHQR